MPPSSSEIERPGSSPSKTAGTPAEIASASSIASEIWSIESSRREPKALTARERVEVRSSGREVTIRISPGGVSGFSPAAAGGRDSSPDIGSRIVIVVPRSRPPLIAKLLQRREISEKPSRRLEPFSSRSTDGLMPAPESLTVTSRESSSGKTAIRIRPMLSG